VAGLVTEAGERPAPGKKAPGLEKTASANEKTVSAPEKEIPGPKKISPPGPEKKTPGPEKTSVTPLEHRRNKLWIIIPVAFAVITLSVLAGLYYYALYFNKPNFEENGYNKILQSTSGPVTPGQEIKYSIEFMNTGNTDISQLSIETEIPANTDVVSSSSNAKIGTDGKKIAFNIGNLAKNSDGKVFFSVKVKNPLDNGT